MIHKIALLLCSSLVLLLINCDKKSTEQKTGSVESVSEKPHTPLNLLTDSAPLAADGAINAVIEIPAGTLDKWELDKTTGQLKWELVDHKPRVVDYIGYPGNYGMIPRTLLPKEKGGDGDPLDILVLGPPAKRGALLKCKLIGVLHLEDRGEQDDKLIAVSADSPMYSIESLDELNANYNGVTEIVQLWFTNYKGPGKMKSKGFGSKKVAHDLLTAAISEYEATLENNQ